MSQHFESDCISRATGSDRSEPAESMVKVNVKTEEYISFLAFGPERSALSALSFRFASATLVQASIANQKI